MERFISKSGIIFTLIFSFLLSFFTSITNPMEVNAAETIQETVDLVSTKREGNTITFTTKIVYDIDSITYQIVYYEGNEKYADLINDAKVNKINDFNYSFEVSDSIVGVKIWKIKYFVSTNYFKNKMTKGNNSVGDIEATYKKNYVEVTTDKLQVMSGLGDDTSSISSKISFDKTYIFFFNLDTAIDKIINLSLEYSIKYEKETWWGLGGSTSVKSYEVKLDHTQQVTDYEQAAIYFANWYESYTGDDVLLNALLQYDYAKNTFKRDVLGANTNGNGYDWYVQPLLDLELVDKNYMLGSGYQRQDLQEVAIVKMSYYAQGEYFEDIPVKDEDTGWIKYEEKDSGFLDRLIETINKIVDIFGGNIILTIIFFVIIISIIIALIKLGIKKTFQGICWIVEKIVSIILNLLKSIIYLPFIILKKIFGKKQE